MERQIIELKKIDQDGTCLICCENEATIKFRVNRIKYDDNVVSFNVCDECLAKMQKDIETCK